MRIAPNSSIGQRLAEWSTPSLDSSPGPRDGGADVLRIGRGDPIVLLPGLAGGRELLMPLARRLARWNQVVMPSLRGDRGVRGSSPARDVPDHTEDLDRCFRRLGLERPILMGVSYGGAIALDYAVTHPDRIGGLATFGAEARFRPTLGTTIARRVCERYPLPKDSPFLNQFFNLLHGLKPAPGPEVDFIVENCWRTDQSVVAHRIAGLEGFDVMDRLWRVDVPTLVVAGSRDVVVPPSRQKALADALAGSSFALIEGAGHVGFVTQAQRVAELAATFAAKVHRSLC